MRAFYNPFTGYFGALCTSDGSKYWQASNKGAIAAKMETSSSIFEGHETFIVASHNSVVTNGGGHKVIPVDDTHSLALIVGTDIVPEDDLDYLAFVQEAETAAINAGRSERGRDACDWYWSENCTQIFLEEWYYNNGRQNYPAFRGGFWGGDLTERELTKIGLMKIAPDGDGVVEGKEQYINWVVEEILRFIEILQIEKSAGFSQNWSQSRNHQGDRSAQSSRE